jgi:hypothetical protein
LTTARTKLKIPAISDHSPFYRGLGEESGFMTPIPPSQSPDKRSPMNECKHPRVQIVSRDEDSEFVECLECGDIFESSEFRDMSIEETKLKPEL